MIRTYTPSQIADAILAGDLVRETEFVLAFEVECLRAFETAHKQLQAALDIAIRERDEARAEVERQIRHGDLLYDQIERRTRERDEARAEVGRMKKLHPPLADLPWPPRGEAKP